MGNLKKGDSFITTAKVTLPVYDMLRNQKSGSINAGTKTIAKGRKIEIHGVLTSKNGNKIYRTNFDSFNAEDLESIL